MKKKSRELYVNLQEGELSNESAKMVTIKTEYPNCGNNLDIPQSQDVLSRYLSTIMLSHPRTIVKNNVSRILC